MRTRHIRKLISSALGLIVLGSLWFYFAPAPLGGSATYVVTHGVSMEPRFHTGDLAIVRSESSYHVGEIVAYHNKMLHTVVLHRIVGRSGNRYIFKGDNNNFVDFEHPAASQLIGALWLHVPGAGATLKSISSPALVGALVAAGVLLFTFTRRRRTRGRRDVAATASAATHIPPRHAEPAIAALAIGLVALLPFVMLALLAFTRPATKLHSVPVPYKQSGTFSYSANAAPGPTYAGDRAVTGDPLFTRVLNNVHVQFSYLFASTAKHSLKGKASLFATLSSTSGWNTTLALGAPTYFHGDRASVAATLDLASLQALMHTIETTTKVGGSYTLTLTPHVSAAGQLEQLPLSTSFAPRLQFSLNELEAQPLLGASSAALGKPAADAFAPSESGSVSARRYAPLFISLKLARMSVATARAVALGGIILVVLAVIAMLAYLGSRRRDALATIRARYSHLIVPVEHVSQLPGVAVIDVADMDALAHIAGHYDRSILYEATDQGHTFWVTDESGQFRYVLDALSPSPQRPPAASAWSAAEADPTPSWAESPTAEFPAVSAVSPSAEPLPATWTEDGTAEPIIAWSEDLAASSNGNGDAPAPAWALEDEIFDPSASDVLASEVYADELELGGVFRASETQPAPPPESVAPEPSIPEGWQAQEEQDTFVQGPATVRARGGVSRTRSGAVVVHVPGF